MKSFTSRALPCALACFLACSLPLRLSAQQNALDFDGLDDQVVAPNASALIAGASQMSMTCWVYPTNPVPGFPDFDGLAGFRNNVDADFYLLQYSPTTVEARFRNSTGTDFNILGQGLQLNTWQHFALTYDGFMLRLYLNGQPNDSVPANGIIVTTIESLYMGTQPYQGTDYYLDGQLDEVSLWNVALTPADVDCIYSGAIDTASAGLQLYYRFNQGVAGGSNPGVTTVTDAKNNIDGVLSNFNLFGPSSNWVGGVANYSQDSAHICPGDTFAFYGQALTAAGLYTAYAPSGPVCDSVIELTLTVTDTSVTDNGVLLHANQIGAMYQWVNCDSGYAAVAGAVSQNFMPATGGHYAVVIQYGGCTDTSACHLFSLTGISEAAFGAAYRVYPNPVTDLLSIGPFDGDAVATVRDLSGRLVTRFDVDGTRGAVRSAIGWRPGVYVLEMRGSGPAVYYRLVKL